MRQRLVVCRCWQQSVHASHVRRPMVNAGRLTSPVAFGNKAMKCEGSEDVLQTVLMANPDQASSLQGSHSVDCDILAPNYLGIGSGWQQSKQNQELLAVVGTLARTGCSLLSSAELSSLRLFLFLFSGVAVRSRAGTGACVARRVSCKPHTCAVCDSWATEATLLESVCGHRTNGH